MATGASVVVRRQDCSVICARPDFCSVRGAIHKKLWSFSSAMLEFAPQGAGVYALWSEGELIYYGRAEGGSETIRSRLREHLRAGRNCVRNATHYSWELARRPAARESDLLSEFWTARGRFPRCNEAETIEAAARSAAAT